MRIKLQVFILVVLSFVGIQNVLSQSIKKQQPLPLVVFNENVNEPLSIGELEKIKEVYGDEAESLILNRPHRLQDIKNILRNRIVYRQTQDGKILKGCPLLSTVPLFDYYVPRVSRDAIFNRDTFNPLKYSFNFYSNSAFMYKVDNSNYYILIKSQHQ
ncbi:MAG: hypothetical protein ABIO60_11320 [Aquaticitalea sp.]